MMAPWAWSMTDQRPLRPSSTGSWRSSTSASRPTARRRVRAFVREYMRRLADEAPTRAPRRCSARRSAPSSSPRAAARAPVAVRAFNPDRGRARLRAARRGARDQHRRPAVPRRLGQRRARGPRPRHRPRRPPDHRHRARRRRAHRRGQAPARRGRDRVGHALRARPPAGAARSSPASRTRSARRSRTSAASCATTRRCAKRVGEMIELARAGEGRYDEDEVAETVAFLRWLLDDNFIFLGARDYEIADDAIGRRAPGRGSACSPTATTRRSRAPVPLESLAADAARADDRGRPAHRLQEQPHVAGAPPRADGLRRRAARRRRTARRAASRACSACSRRRRTSSRRARRRCCTASCAGSSRPRT